MIRRRVVLLGCLLLMAFAPAALAFIDPPVLVPDHPVAGEPVSVSMRAGVCDDLVEKPGYPKITRTGSSIHVLIASVHAASADWCIYYPVATAVIQVGTFPSGNYTMKVDRTYENFFGEEVVETLGTIEFSVAPVQPVMVPTVGLYGIAAMLAGLLVLGALFLRRYRAGSILVMLLFVVPLGARAQATPDNQVVAILLNNASSAPSPQQVVNYHSNTSHSRAPPLASLAATNPETVAYLLPLRSNGDFAAFLAAHPESARAKLERYLIARYPTGATAEAALNSLSLDPAVAIAYAVPSSNFSSVQLLRYQAGRSGSPSQYGRTALNIEDAWQLASGYALVGMIDSGLAVSHQALEQFSPSGQYIGGNFIPVASLDIGDWPNSYDNNVDEAEPLPLPSTSLCNPQGLPAVPPIIAGHGTHTSGLLAANPGGTISVKGTCDHCGIAMWKASYLYCSKLTSHVRPALSGAAIVAAITLLSDSGAQVINMSFGGPRADPDYCASNPSFAYCEALTYAYDREITLVASSGNARTKLNFPASDPRVVAAGGFEQGLLLWDESPGSLTNCPDYPRESECGSNYTTVLGGPRQELMASADAVLSTFYPNYDWNQQVHCGDSFGTPTGDGVGLCTGTSMSAPQVSGVMGIVRSINPLVPAGKPTYNPPFGVMGVRYVVASTTFESQANQGWSQTFGYGHPDAEAATRMMLGKVAGATARNRATPLFRLVSTNPNDHAAVTSPQYAVALLINQANSYAPAGTQISSYTAFPTGSNITLPAPRAGAYVLTTDVKPRNDWPNLLPLHLVTKDLGIGFDYMLVTTDSEVEQAHAAGYNLRNIQGYVYQPCTPESTCIPPGAERLYRACNSVDNDCAVFLESERLAFEAAGFTSAWPAGSNKRIGYAYPSGDSDNDGLPDGFEYVIGTNPAFADSDGDYVSDGDEFPLAGVATRDPCSGGTYGASRCPADIIFDDGFEGPI